MRRDDRQQTVISVDRQLSTLLQQRHRYQEDCIQQSPSLLSKRVKGYVPGGVAYIYIYIYMCVCICGYMCMYKQQHQRSAPTLHKKQETDAEMGISHGHGSDGEAQVRMGRLKFKLTTST